MSSRFITFTYHCKYTLIQIIGMYLDAMLVITHWHEQCEHVKLKCKCDDEEQQGGQENMIVLPSKMDVKVNDDKVINQTSYNTSGTKFCVNMKALKSMSSVFWNIGHALFQNFSQFI